MKINILGKSLQELQAFVTTLGESRYRGDQLYSWLYKFQVPEFQEMTNLPAVFRDSLSEHAYIEQFPVVSKQTSFDGTTKFLFELTDTKRIETVLIPPRASAVDAEDRLTLCVSTQVGCPLDCSFCATATMGFHRNLTVSEIINQILTAQRHADKPITNLVFMGMGEPLLNYDTLMDAIDIISDQQGIGISPRRITISTAGYANIIRKMGEEERKPKLALSLHSTIDEVRNTIMPINKKHGVRELIDALEYYQRKTKKSVMLEFILFEGLNDTAEEVRNLSAIAKRIDCRVNLIPFHPIDHTFPTNTDSRLQGASSESIQRFWKQLRDQGVTAFIRHSAGIDIDAACGQLAAKEQEIVP